ncbi:ATP-binding protein [Spirochaeta dissipatitropha]
MEREIIEINEDLCIGCGNCIPNCHQGALQIIDGKARLISDLMCEGIGVCVGACPTGAMSIEKREAEAYDEFKVMQKICAGGPNVIQAHIDHLKQHKQNEYLAQAYQYLETQGIQLVSEDNRESSIPDFAMKTMPGMQMHAGGGCPGAAARSLRQAEPGPARNSGIEQDNPSELRQWPVQLHLLNPAAPYLRRADLVLAADCTAFAYGSFHRDFLHGKIAAIACPKLDSSQENYVHKLTQMIEHAQLNTMTVVTMEVPCCSGLVRIAREAAATAQRKIPLKSVVISIDGEILQEEWL